jgi:hypothetical protein
MDKTRTVIGELKVLETANPKLYAVEIMALNSEVNRNNWQYINLEQHLNEFLDIPILTAYVGGGMIIGDGHNYAVKRDPKTGEEYASFTASDAERIVGWIPKDQSNVRLEVIDGIEWVIVKGNLWAFYAKELVDQIARQGSMEVSIETLVTDERKGEDGVDIEEKYLVLGITILGNGVEPAVAGANIKTLSELSELRSNMAENILKAASYAGNAENPQEEPEDEDSDEEKDEPDEDSSEDSPKDNESKGVKRSMTYLSRKELAELGPKFPDYRVLAAMQDENGAIRVCLMAKDANFSTYKMDSRDENVFPESVLPERYQRIPSKVNFVLGDDCDNAEIDTCEVIDTLTADLTADRDKYCASAKDLEEKLNAANERIKAMETAERARRVQAAKEKAHAVLNSLNANRAAKAQFEDSILDSVLADIDAGKYTEKVNADGLWVGDAEVERDVSYLCMNAQKDMDKKAAEAAETTFAYNKFLSQKGEKPDGIEGLLSELDKII